MVRVRVYMYLPDGWMGCRLWSGNGSSRVYTIALLTCVLYIYTQPPDAVTLNYNAHNNWNKNLTY